MLNIGYSEAISLQGAPVHVANIFILIANSLVIAGSGILINILFVTLRLCKKLTSGDVRSNKYFLIVPMLLFVLGYLGYLLSFWSTQNSLQDLIIPGVLFTSACSLWLVFKMALHPIIRLALEQGNITDPLTGIYNRRHLERRLTEEVARAHRYSLPLSVFLLDIDQFRRINATYGHRVGNLVLIHFSKVLLDYLRESDEVARYDQDTLLVMTPNTTIDDAHLLAERIRQRVEVQPLLHDEAGKIERIAMQVSIGVSSLQGGFDSLDKLLQRAEASLQQAQQAGGNCVIASEPPVIKNPEES